MKTVRLFYKKGGRAKYISHLDTMRAMTRLLRRTGLDTWYTEGFNPHLYITFAMPLSLGFGSDYEIADIRLNDDNYKIDNLPELLNSCAPDGFYFFAAKEPVKKLSDLTFAEFSVEFSDAGTLAENLKAFLRLDEISVEKKTKKGDIKIINAAPDIKKFSVENKGNTVLFITLPAGPQKTVNPELIISKFLKENGECFIKITRTALLDENLLPLE